MYYLYGNGDSRDPEGPFTEEALLARLESLSKANSPDFFRGFAFDFDLAETNKLRPGQWAVIRVEVIEPRPVNVVKAWALPED